MFVRAAILGILLLGLVSDNLALKDTQGEKIVQTAELGLMALLTFVWFANADHRAVPRVILISGPMLLMLLNQVWVQQFRATVHGEEMAIVLAYCVSTIVCMVVIPHLLIRHGLLRWFAATVFVLSVLLALSTLLGSVMPVGAMGSLISQKPTYQIWGLVASGGLLEHPITMSMQSSIGIILGMHLLWTEQRFRTLVGIGTGIVVLGLLATMSRSGMAGLAAGGLVFLALRTTRLRTFGYFVGLGLVAATAFGAYQFALTSPTLSQYLRIDRGLSGRQELWDFSMGLVMREPLGRGYGESMREIQNETFFAAGSDLSESKSAGNHSNFMDAAVNFGIQGVALLYLVIFFCIFMGLRNSKMWSLGILVASIGTAYLVGCHFISINLGGVRFTAVCYAIFLGLGPISISQLAYRRNERLPVPVGSRRLTSSPVC